jgi:hypothetical protein
VFISIEALAQVSSIAIYPKVTTFAGNSSSNPFVKNYSICNTTSSNITGITWSKSGSSTGANNASNWFVSPSISTIDASSCQNFSLSISIDPTASLGVHDANIVATKDGNTAVSYISITVQ